MGGSGSQNKGGKRCRSKSFTLGRDPPDRAMVNFPRAFTAAAAAWATNSPSALAWSAIEPASCTTGSVDAPPEAAALGLSSTTAVDAMLMLLSGVVSNRLCQNTLIDLLCQKTQRQQTTATPTGLWHHLLVVMDTLALSTCLDMGV